MQRITSLVIFILIAAIAQSTAQAKYWQQQVDYDLEVSLNDEEHLLTGKARITYHNFSPNALPHLFFHFWANAYSDKSTPLFKQLAQDGELAARFASKDEMGYMKDLAFTANNQPLSLEYVDKFKEIGKVQLKTPLQPGDSIVIETPFTVKLPGDLSRGGHVGQTYNVTQWFPKAALYDTAGWHTMPYLNWGEYYDNFGNYDVRITVPQPYAVGATGNLRTPAEEEWLDKRVTSSTRAIAKENYSFLESVPTTNTKTLRFTERNVHDFAWFASKKFLVQKKAFVLQDSTDTVTAYAFFPSDVAKSWDDATEYLEKSVKFYSEEVGTYPYRTVTAVHGALKAGGGMEYPTITVISPGTESVVFTVILHEVGHNWFQGMLGTNERRFPYMDEAINSFYENKYFNSLNDGSTDAAIGGFEEQFFQVLQSHNALRLEDQANNLHAADYHPMNYGTVVYQKAAFAFNYLEDYLGDSVFSACMKTFFDEWQYRHPQPNDLQAVFERVSARDLGWFFEDLMSTDGFLDYAVVDGNETEVTIENQGDIAAPIKITFKNQGVLIQERWVDGFEGKQTFSATEGGKLQFDEAIVNDEVQPYELNTQNNYLYNGQPSGKGFGLRLITPFSLSRDHLAFAPILGSNTSDGLMPGLAFYNAFVPQRKVEFQSAIMYGISSERITGTAKLQYNHFWHNKYHHHLRAGICASSFTQSYFDPSASEGNEIQYPRNTRIEPFVRWKWKKLPIRSSLNHTLLASFIYRSLPYSYSGAANFTQFNFSTVNLEHVVEDTYPLFPFELRTRLQLGTAFSRIDLRWKGEIPYSEDRSIRFRVFAGTLLGDINQPGNSTAFNYRLSGNYGLFDPMMEGFLLDRSMQGGIWSRQMLGTGGAFTTLNSVFSSNSYMASFGLSTPFPVLLPSWIRFYGNAGILPSTPFTNETTLLWEGGIMLSIAKDVFEIYVPLAHSSQMQDYLEVNNRGIVDNISFRLNFNKLNPFRLVDMAPLIGGL